MTYLTSHFCYHFLLIMRYVSLAKSLYINESNTETEVRVLIHYDVYIKIECFNITDYNEFRKRIFQCTNNVRNETMTLKINNCPLPDDGSSLGTMMRKLGIILYPHLLIKNYDLSPKQLTRQQLSHFHSLKSLTLQLKHLSQLPRDLFADITLRNLTTLDLYTNVSKLPNNLFLNLRNLICLNIGHNLKNIDNGQFHKQEKLRYLNLSNNMLRNIGSNIFVNGASIKSIQLENNFLQTMPSEIFATLPNLTAIEINFNEFQNLPAKLFQRNLLLNQFILTENRIDILTLSEEFLANLFHLKRVRVQCGLESLPDSIFYNSTNIKEIILHHNMLTSLTNNLLESQKELIYLDLSHNRLETISAELFRSTKKLKTLTLANNRLKAVGSNLFSNLENLNTLDLSHNQLVYQDFKLNLETNTALDHLFLQNNFISELHILHRKLPRYLKVLNLSHNTIRILSGKNLELLYTNHLKLNLSHNQIQTLQLQDFGKYRYNQDDTPDIIITDLNENPIQCDCEILESIKYLNGSENYLIFNTDNLICLGPIHLKGKRLKNVKEMELLCSLQTKYVGNYKCPKECECWLRLYDNILMVNCSHKNFTQVPRLSSIKNYYNLKGIELNLTNNQITSLPSIHKSGGYAECTKLFLSDNNLTEIDKFHIPANLTYLDTRRNRLQFLSKDTLIFLNSSKSLENIILTENKWICDCSNSDLMSQLNLNKFIDASKVTCHNYPGTKLLQELNDLCNERKIIEIIIICSSLATILLILALYYKYQQEINILIYNICPKFVRMHDNDDNNEENIYDAFICYSHKDEDFIANYLVPELENGNPPFKLCVHVRDFVVGDYILDQIVKSIDDSSRTIMVLSKNFIESEWAKMEFRESYRATLRERRSKIIAIMYEDIGDLCNLDKDLRLYLKMNSYLKWGDSQFWQKLRHAMPHK